METIQQNRTGGFDAEQVIAHPLASVPRRDYASDDIEVIDLDNSREQIRPTTWHRQGRA